MVGIALIFSLLATFSHHREIRLAARNNHERLGLHSVESLTRAGRDNLVLTRRTFNQILDTRPE